MLWKNDDPYRQLFLRRRINPPSFSWPICRWSTIPIYCKVLALVVVVVVVVLVVVKPLKCQRQMQMQVQVQRKQHQIYWTVGSSQDSNLYKLIVVGVWWRIIITWEMTISITITITITTILLAAAATMAASANSVAGCPKIRKRRNGWPLPPCAMLRI